MNLSTISFHVDKNLHSIKTDDVTPETTLNTYLRDIAHLTGTKRMCLEGGCGSCVVSVEEIDPATKQRKVFAVNSCLVSIYSCHGWKIHTIEGIGDPVVGYHKLQHLLADNNGTQCGFCSPGMIMNMYSLSESGPVTKEQIENSFGGNICRCTGYRPILDAFKKLADIEDYSPCYDKTECKQQCVVPCTKMVSFEVNGAKWMKVYTVADLMQLLRTISGTYMLVAGNTARGVYKDKPLPDNYIDISAVKELISCTVLPDTVVLGANMSLTKTMECFKEVAAKNLNFAYLSKLADHIDLIANVPVRNVGTLAGNLMIKHGNIEFPSDIFLILETVNATILIVDADGNETRTTPEVFLKVDMKQKFLKNIILNGYDSTYKYGSFKIMPRAQNAHALVNAGFLFKMKDDTVSKARIVYGAINPTFVHAKSTEDILKSKSLYDNKVLLKAFQSLDAELKPDWVLPDSSPEFRKQLAISLLYKFILSVVPDDKISSRNKSAAALLQRPVSSGTQEFGSDKSEYPLTEPVIKLEALAQTSGQAEYIADIPDLPGQLYAAFVLANASANSVISAINTDKALALPGVVAFYDKSSIPGQNNFFPKQIGGVLDEHLFADGVVEHYSQAIGIIVANNWDLAEKAAGLVEVTYTPPTKKPFLKILDVLQAGAKENIHHKSTVVPKRKGTDIKHEIDGKFYIGLQYHFHMELQCCNVKPTEDGLNVYPSSQWMDAIQCTISNVLNIPSQKINVLIRRCGGAFGAKISRNNQISAAAALAAHKLNRPVKLWMPLEKNMTAVGKRFPLYVEYKVGVNDAGVIQYLTATLYSDYGIGGNEDINSMLLDLFENVYDISTWDFTTNTVTTNTHANTWARAPGTVEGLAAIESIMEHIAYTIKKDPMDVKIANFNTKKFDKIPAYVKDLNEWGKIASRKTDIATFNKSNRWKKRGMSVVPMAWTLEVFGQFINLVNINHCDGGVVVAHGGVEIGQGINTKVAQVAAYKLGVKLDKVSVKPSNTLASPNAFVTGGSLTSEAVCYATAKACDILLARIKPVRDKMDNPTWEDLIQKCYNDSVPLSASADYTQNEPNIQTYLIYGICATEVEVDLLTGQHQILQVDIIEDVGESISPLIDVGQVEGAFVMGAGYYTTEEIVFNDEGKILTDRTWNYKPPGAKDIPISFRLKFPSNNPNPVGVLKSKAIAEPPICLTVAVPLAIRNALASARGDSDSTKPVWYPMDGCSSVESTFLNSLNKYEQYVL